jgi:hypothetical protein
MTDETVSESQGNENSEEPDSNKSGNKIEYTKADLLWELTRRNQNYIKSFNTFKKIYLKLWPDLDGVKNHIIKGIKKTFDLDSIPTSTEHENISQNPRRLPGLPNEWEIMMKAAIPMSNCIGFNFSDFKSYTWLDPDITIDQIKNELNHPGADPLAIHPYHALTNLVTPDDLFYHYAYFDDRSEQLKPGEKKLIPFSNNINIGMFYEYNIEGEIYICIKKKSLGRQILMMLDPLKGDKHIISASTSVKSKVQPALEEKIKKQGDRTYSENPNDIKIYFKWIKTYDDINSTYKQIEEKAGRKPNLINDRGALVLPKDANLRNIVRELINDEEKLSSANKRMRGQYLETIKLIQNTPDIPFTSARDQKRTSRSSADL